MKHVQKSHEILLYYLQQYRGFTTNSGYCTTMLVVEERRVGHVDGGPGDGAFWPKSVVSGRQCSYQSDPFSQKDKKDRGETGEMWKIFWRGCISPPEKKEEGNNLL